MLIIKPSALVLLALGALVASIASGESDERPAASELLGRLYEPNSLEAGVTSEQTFALLSKVLELDQTNEEARALLDAHKIIQSRCTMEHQKWLIRQLLKSKNTPIGAYLADIRQQYRVLCSQTFKTRLLLAILQLDVDVEYAIGDYTKHLAETRDLRENLHSMDEVPFESLVAALKAYLAHQVETASDVLRDPHRSQQVMSWSIERLSEACEQITITLSDFLWMLKVIDTPPFGGLGAENEELLWGVKVCNWLQLANFETELAARQARVPASLRQLLRKFTNLLHVPDEIWLDGMYQLKAETLKGAVERLVEERHFRSQKGEEKFEMASKLLDEIEVACISQLEKTHDFLWLVDIGLKSSLEKADSKAALKLARACKLLPFIHFNQ